MSSFWDKVNFFRKFSFKFIAIVTSRKEKEMLYYGKQKRKSNEFI